MTFRYVRTTPVKVIRTLRSNQSSPAKYLRRSLKTAETKISQTVRVQSLLRQHRPSEYSSSHAEAKAVAYCLHRRAGGLRCSLDRHRKDLNALSHQDRVRAFCLYTVIMAAEVILCEVLWVSYFDRVHLVVIPQQHFLCVLCQGSEKARSSIHPEVWQTVKETPQEGYGYGIRRPLQYIQALRQSNRKPQPNVHGQVQVISWQKPQGSSLTPRRNANIQNQPVLYHQTQNPYQTQPDVATEWTQEMPPSQPLPQRNYLKPKPRSFEFSLKIPFANFPDQSKDTSPITKGSALNSGGNNGASHSQLYRPNSIQIHSRFNSPSGSDGFSDKGSTNNPNGGLNVHDASKPSFQLSLSVPIASPTPTTKPTSSNIGYFANHQRPGSGDFVQTINMEPPILQSSSTQHGFSFNSDGNAEHQSKDPGNTKRTEGITFSTDYVSQHATPAEHSSQEQVPTEPASSQPTPNYPPQFDNVDRRYYNGKVNPSSQFERAPNGHYSGGHLKPYGNTQYSQGETGQSTGSQFTFASEQYNSGQLKPSYSYEHNEEAIPHPAYPTISSSQYELPSFGYANREVAATTNYDRMSDIVQKGQIDFSPSSSPYQYSNVQSREAPLPDHLTASDHLPNVQYQTQVRRPGGFTGSHQLARKPTYTKLLIDMEDETDGADGPNYFATPTTHYNPHSGMWPGHNMATPPVRNPSPLFMNPRSRISVNKHPITGFEYVQRH
ncbi:hypothetical protein PAMA_019036 [Pampus argenteus]